MSETFVEVLVERRTNPLLFFLKWCFITLGIFLFLSGVLLAISFFVLGGILCFLLFYVCRLFAVVEYEYCYLDKEMTVDKILNRSKRRKVLTIDFERMEIMAPINSHRLDSYRHITGKALDYSSGIIEEPDIRYMMYFDGGKKMIFEPNEALVNMIKNIAPRKVFTD